MRVSPGFTLIELLVVIAVIAILAVVVILALNPAEMLRQSRDSNRISDMATLKSAISVFQADVATSSANALGYWPQLYANSGVGSPATGTSYNNTNWGFATVVAANAGAPTSSAIVTSTSRAINGQGWLPVNFSAISSGAPIGNLPVDPVNTASNTYTFLASSTLFKLATKMESIKYNASGSGDAVSSDGGNNNTTLEAGTKLTL